MRHGVAVGKFYPFHKGHEYLLRTGRANCECLHVMVCASQRWEMGARMRRRWIQTVLRDLDGLRVTIFDQDASGLEDHDSPGWAKATIHHLGLKPDIVVCSEDYAQEYAKHMGAEALVVDKARELVPISGTLIRQNPRKHAHFLDSIVLQDLLTLNLVGST